MKAKSLCGLLTAAAVVISMCGSVSKQQGFEEKTVYAETAMLSDGDLNGDNELTVADAVILAHFLAEDEALPQTVISSVTLESADIDKDHLLTMLDMKKLLEIITANAMLVPSVPDDPLTIIFWSGWESEFNQMIEIFEANHPEYANKVRFVTVGNSGAEAREGYANYFAGGEDVDLYLVDYDWRLDYISNDQYSVPLTRLGFHESDFDQCFPYTLRFGRDKNGTLKAVTWMAAPGAYVYRADLAKTLLGAATPEEMQHFVKDWDTFTQTAETVRGLTNGKTAMADCLGSLWQIWSCNIRESYIDSNGKAQISDAGRSFVDFAKLYYDKGYVTKAEQWSDDWYTIGQNDATMGFFHCTWCLVKDSMLSYSEGGVNGATYGKYRITEGPAQWYWGGAEIAVSPKCNSREIAHDFLYDITVDPNTMLQYMNERGEFVNNDAAISKFNNDSGYGNPLLGGQSQYPTLLNNVRSFDLPAEPMQYDSDLDWLFYRTVGKYLKGEIITYDGLQSTFQREAAKILP